MRAKKLLLRCYAEHDGNLWVAFCLDFSLGCQGDSFEEVRTKLDAQIRDYVSDALCGEDRQHADYLLTRRAPLSYWLRYWVIRLQSAVATRLHANRSQSSRPFKEPLPLIPASC
ncbi:MAG: DUF1902 domain-containing protein [Rhodanobacter sp.]|nr:MAG: DUF1902 domain-containing protein [Rhodanobacter sp.]